MKTIAILGCGNIGRIVAGQAENVRIVGVFDQDRDRCHAVAALCGATACESFDALMTLDFDLLVEAASVEAAEEYAPRVIEAGRDLVMLSVGALADDGLRARLENLARVSGAKLRIPSGAVIGLDNLKQRLEKSYSGSYSFNIEPGDGQVTITVEIPTEEERGP